LKEGKFDAQELADASRDDDPVDLKFEDDDDYLTDWEREFHASVGCQDYELTDAQQAKLAEIEALVEERRAPGLGALPAPPSARVARCELKTETCCKDADFYRFAMPMRLSRSRPKSLSWTSGRAPSRCRSSSRPSRSKWTVPARCAV
jgi:hypothetical protein